MKINCSLNKMLRWPEKSGQPNRPAYALLLLQLSCHCRCRCRCRCLFALGGFSGWGLFVKYTHRGGQLQSKLFAQGVARRGFCNLLDFVIVIIIGIIMNSCWSSSCSPALLCPRNLIEKEAHTHTHIDSKRFNLNILRVPGNITS